MTPVRASLLLTGRDGFLSFQHGRSKFFTGPDGPRVPGLVRELSDRVLPALMNKDSKHLAFLDGTRGVAIIMVVLFHILSKVYGFDMNWKGWFRDFSAPASFFAFLPVGFGGAAGVAIFFVVSGFCIHLSFQRQGSGWGHFFTRRFFRIYPAYLAALVFSLALAMAQSGLDFQAANFWARLESGDWGWQFLTHLFLVHNATPATVSALNGSFWTLGIEAQLYLLYPLLLGLAARLGWRRTMFLLGGGEVLIRTLWGAVETAGGEHTLTGQVAWLLAYSPLGFWFSWSLGAMLAEAYLHNRPLPFLKTPPVWWLGLAAAVYFFKPLNHLQFLLFAVMAAALISRMLNGTGFAMKVPAFSLSWLQKIGLWSYSLYLVHYPLLNLFYNAVNYYVSVPIFHLLTEFLLLTIMALMLIPLARLWYQLCELPGIAWGRQILARRGRPQITGAGRPRRQTSPPADSPTGGHRTAGYAWKAGLLLALAAGAVWGTAKLQPPNPGEANDLAWSLATSSDAAKRNGTVAVQLAEYACSRTQYRETIMVGTLAAAYAEAGQFDRAISTAQKACELAKKNGRTDLLQRNQELLAIYQQHQPYHEDPVNPEK